jgi:zinc protease
MKSPAKFSLLLSLSFLAGAASPGLPARAERPVTAGVVKRTLPNGLRVLVLPRHTAPVVTTMMWYRVGSRDETPGATGMAHFLEHLLFKGTHKLAKGAIDRITYRNGGSNNAFTFNDYTAFEFNFPRRSWKAALSIEADRMRNCVFDRKEFEAERQVVMEERRGIEDEPAQAFSEQLEAMAFLVHPYRNPAIGWMEDIKRVTRDEVYAFYQKHYLPANATLVITGDVSPEDALAAASAAFAAVPNLPAPVRSVVVEPPQTAARRLRLSRGHVGRLGAMFPVPSRKSADVYALEILAYALAEGKLSRLYQRLVEKEGLAADVDSGLGIYRDAGTLTLEASAKEGASLDRLEAALWEELDRVTREPLTAPEMERARNQFYAGWVHGFETANELATAVGEADALGGHEYLDTLLSRVEKVTAEDVQRVARTYLRRDHSTVGWLEPEGPSAVGSQQSAVGSQQSAVGGQACLQWSIGSRGRRGDLTSGSSGTAWKTVETDPPAPNGCAIVAEPLASLNARKGLCYRHPAVAYRGTGARPSLRPPSPTPQSAIRNPQAAAFQPLRPAEKLLPNGMRLILLENHDLPSVTLSTRVDAGSFQETDAQAGLANLAARLLDEGTDQRGHQQISEALEQVGASFSASAGRAATYVELKTLSRSLNALLPLYAELLRRPSFPEDRLDQERSRLLVAFREEEDNAEEVAEKAFDELVYGSHPAHRPIAGTASTVRALTSEALREFHRRFYRPERCTLVAVGDFRTADLLERLTAAFGDWPKGEAGTTAPLPPLQRQHERRERRVRMEKTQTQIVLGHLGITRTNPDYLALEVMDAILGEGVSGGFTARIPYQLRDVQGLAYTVGSSITATAGREPGEFVATLGTEPAKEGAAIAALLKEIRRIRSEPVTETELREAANYLANSYVFQFQTDDQLAGYLHAVQYYGLGFNYRQQYVRDLRKVTRADVLRVAWKYLDPDHYTLVVVGPDAKPKQ